MEDSMLVEKSKKIKYSNANKWYDSFEQRYITRDLDEFDDELIRGRWTQQEADHCQYERYQGYPNEDA